MTKLLPTTAPSLLLEGGPYGTTPRRRGHYFDSVGHCDCGVTRALSEGRWWYQYGGGWSTVEGVCTAKRRTAT